MSWPLPLPKIDPMAASNPREFNGLLRKLQDYCHISYQEIASKLSAMAADGKKYSKSTVQRYVTGETLSPWPFVARVLKTCGIPDEEIRGSWLESYSRCLNKERTYLEQRLSDGNVAKSIELDELAAELSERIHHLDTELSAVVRDRDRLQNELDDARHQAAGDYNRITDLQAKLDKAHQDIGELRARLDFALMQYRQLAAQRAEVGQAADDLELLKEFRKLEYERAEFERRGRTEAEKRVLELEQRLRQIEQRPDAGQPASNKLRDKPKSTPLGENAPKTMEWPARPEELVDGKRLKISATYAWYCPICKCGGESRYVTQCPAEGHPVKTQFRVPLTAILPENPRYGISLLLPGAGNSDNPIIPTSDLHVVLVPPDQLG